MARSALFGRYTSPARQARTLRELAVAHAHGFETYHQYRKVVLGSERGLSPSVAAGHARQGETPLARRSVSHRAQRDNALHAVSAQRREPWLSQDQAAGIYGLSATDVRRLVPGAFTGEELLAHDTATRHINIISGGEVVPVTVHSSRQASLAGEYMAAVKVYQATGDERVLDKFKGKTIAGYELEADPDMLGDLLSAGDLDGVVFYWEIAA